jgi:hypothetical protein
MYAPLGFYMCFMGPVCPLGAHLCPLDLNDVPWGSNVCPPSRLAPSYACALFLCVHHGVLLSPLGLLYVLWRLIYAPWGSSACPLQNCTPP